MKFIRILLLPIVPVYFFITWLRNICYDLGIKSSKSYNLPIICIGNLSTGGTGKTPMTEYVVSLLTKNTNVATLSRGYKRKTKWFLLANKTTNATDIGDEPFQIYNKFRTISVAVDENRQHGIDSLKKLKPNTEVIILDDAFQHRKVTPGFSILLTAYNNLFYNDFVLPTGNLREPKSGAKRANVIVVTKCPKNIKETEKLKIISRIKPKPSQNVFFSSISYSENVFSEAEQKPLKNFKSFTLLTGIANPKPLIDHLKEKSLSFEHLKFPDHYNFTDKDIEKFSDKDVIITTEKDYTRLAHIKALKNKLYYLPITITIDNHLEFNKLITNFVKNN